MNATYDPVHFESLFAAEDQHFWFEARRKVILDTARRCLGQSANPKILEIGCGTGSVLKELEGVGASLLVGLDLFSEGLRLAQRRVTSSLVQGDAVSLPFATASFDLIGLFDVIEHVDDDISLLWSVQQACAPNGRVLITVPAHMNLWSYFDEVALHRRRYSEEELRRKLGHAGFEIEFFSLYMMATAPVIYLRRKLRLQQLGKKKATSLEASVTSSAAEVERELHVPPGINSIMRMLLRPERLMLARGWKVPIGTSYIVTARKQN